MVKRESLPDIRLPEDMFIGSIKEQIKKLFIQATLNKWMAGFQLSVLEAKLKSGEKMSNLTQDKLREQKDAQKHAVSMEEIALDKLMLEAQHVGLDLNDPKTWATNCNEENIGASLVKERQQNTQPVNRGGQ